MYNAVMCFIMFTVSSIVLFIAYIYGWDSGLREGKSLKHGPYYMIEQGWEIHLPDGKGIIKLIKNPKEGAET